MAGSEPISADSTGRFLLEVRLSGTRLNDLVGAKYCYIRADRTLISFVFYTSIKKSAFILDALLNCSRDYVGGMLFSRSLGCFFEIEIAVICLNPAINRTFLLSSPNSHNHMIRFKSLLALLAGLFFAISAYSWDGMQTGTVTQLDITDSGNFGLRVFLSSGVPMCGGSNYFGYLNSTDSNYNTYVSAIMLAKATGARLTLYLTNVNGFCHIGYVTMV